MQVILNGSGKINVRQPIYLMRKCAASLTTRWRKKQNVERSFSYSPPFPRIVGKYMFLSFFLSPASRYFNFWHPESCMSRLSVYAHAFGASVLLSVADEKAVQFKMLSLLLQRRLRAHVYPISNFVSLLFLFCSPSVVFMMLANSRNYITLHVRINYNEIQFSSFFKMHKHQITHSLVELCVLCVHVCVSNTY